MALTPRQKQVRADWKIRNPEKWREVIAKYSASEKGRLAKANRRRRERAKYPDKHRARNILWNAILSGRIIRPLGCRDCGTIGPVQGHHQDYSRPLDVQWLCGACHRAAHQREETTACTTQK